MAVEIEKFDFDPDFLRKKYREERDKRLRQDGNDQYQEVKGEFSYFVEDPYIDEEIEREAFKEELVSLYGLEEASVRFVLDPLKIAMYEYEHELIPIDTDPHDE